MEDLRIIDPPYFDPVHEEASYYEWLEEQGLLDEEFEEVARASNQVDYSILDDIPLEDLPF